MESEFALFDLVWSFVGDAALVAYNAASDMTFLEKGSEWAGVAFDNPVLDALVLSVYLQEEVSDFSFTAAAEQAGVEVVGRHTALGGARANGRSGLPARTARCGHLCCAVSAATCRAGVS